MFYLNKKYNNSRVIIMVGFDSSVGSEWKLVVTTWPRLSSRNISAKVRECVYWNISVSIYSNKIFIYHKFANLWHLIRTMDLLHLPYQTLTLQWKLATIPVITAFHKVYCVYTRDYFTRNLVPWIEPGWSFTFLPNHTTCWESPDYLNKQYITKLTTYQLYTTIFFICFNNILKIIKIFRKFEQRFRN